MNAKIEVNLGDGRSVTIKRAMLNGHCHGCGHYTAQESAGMAKTGHVKFECTVCHFVNVKFHECVERGRNLECMDCNEVVI